MNAHNSKVLVVLLSTFLSLPLFAFRDARLQDNTAATRVALREVHDETDPNEVQACYALGRLDITFSTEKKGPPAIGMVVTDPRGRRIGFDPIEKSGFQQLPQAQGYIDCDAPGTEGACTDVIEICGPISGTYKLEVIAVQNSEYNLTVSGRSQEVRGEKHTLEASDSNAELKDATIQKGSREVLLLNYSRDPKSKVAFQRQAPVPMAGNE